MSGTGGDGGLAPLSGELLPDGSLESEYSDGGGTGFELDDGAIGAYQGLTPLYKRLPHGPHGLGREAVARHQRARL
jgi:hypothetical protein